MSKKQAKWIRTWQNEICEIWQKTQKIVNLKKISKLFDQMAILASNDGQQILNLTL